MLMKGTDTELAYLVKPQETEDFSSLMCRASRDLSQTRSYPDVLVTRSLTLFALLLLLFS